MNHKLNKFLDYIFWIVWGLVGLWIILKIAGVIQTPIWIEMAPYAGFFFMAGKMHQTLNHLQEEITNLQIEMKYTQKKLNNIEQRLTLIEHKFT